MLVRAFSLLSATLRGSHTGRKCCTNRARKAKTPYSLAFGGIPITARTQSSRGLSHAAAIMDDKIEVLLHGLGSIGAFYAFILQKSSTVRLSVTARSNYEAVKANGLLMQSDNHGEHRFYPAATLRTPGEAGHPFDFIVCANKATDLEFTADQLAPVVDEVKTTIVLMQNGVGNENPFHKRFPNCPILSGVVSSLIFVYSSLAADCWIIRVAC